jgi:spore maturation protein CgeB
LCRGLSEKGHRVVFFEHDVPYYAGARDLYEMPGNDELVLYENWYDIAARAAREVSDAEVAIVTSYCPDAIAATDLILGSRALRVFYDLDTPVTLSRHARGEMNFYIGPRGLADFDLVLSYTGGGALDALREDLGARVSRRSMVTSIRNITVRPNRGMRTGPICPISAPMPRTGRHPWKNCSSSRQNGART